MTMTLTEMARKGGRTRAKKLSKKRLHEIAVKAGNANKRRIKAGKPSKAEHKRAKERQMKKAGGQ